MLETMCASRKAVPGPTLRRNRAAARHLGDVLSRVGRVGPSTAVASLIFMPRGATALRGMGIWLENSVERRLHPGPFLSHEKEANHSLSAGVPDASFLVSRPNPQSSQCRWGQRDYGSDFVAVSPDRVGPLGGFSHGTVKNPG